MYDYAPNGDLHMEVLFNEFIQKVFDKWKTLAVSHYLTVVLFSRTFFHTKGVSRGGCASNFFVILCMTSPGLVRSIAIPGMKKSVV